MSRKVIYHPDKGVLLGVRQVWSEYQAIWSRADSKDLLGDELVPTFVDHAEFDGWLFQWNPKIPSGYWLHEVKPTGPDNLATMQDCARSGIQKWGKEHG